MKVHNMSKHPFYQNIVWQCHKSYFNVAIGVAFERRYFFVWRFYFIDRSKVFCAFNNTTHTSNWSYTTYLWLIIYHIPPVDHTTHTSFFEKTSPLAPALWRIFKNAGLGCTCQWQIFIWIQSFEAMYQQNAFVNTYQILNIVTQILAISQRDITFRM